MPASLLLCARLPVLDFLHEVLLIGQLTLAEMIDRRLLVKASGSIIPSDEALMARICILHKSVSCVGERSSSHQVNKY